MQVSIKPLSRESLDSAMSLVIRVFPEQEDYEKSDFWLPASLGLVDWTKKEPNTIFVKYWVVQERKNVIGIVGLYGMRDDIDHAYWLSWFCVDPEFRGKGIEKTLLDFAIAETTSAGKKFLKLYTSDEPDAATAQTLYEKKEFVTTKTEQGNGYMIIYKTLKLGDKKKSMK